MTYTTAELTQQRDPQGNVTAYAYDQAGRQTLVTEPVTGTVQYQYDAVGNTVAITNADMVGTPLSVETRIYDALNRVTSDSVTGPGSPTTTLTTLTAYTRDGQAAVTQQPNGDTTTTAYDNADEALSTTLLSNGTITTEGTYSYDGAGNQSTSTDTDGRTVSTVYDPDNRVAQTTATGGGTVTVATTMGYDPDGNTVAQTAQTTDSAHPGQVQVATHAATYDAGDRQATETDNGLTTVYGYDAQGQQRVATVQDGQTAVSTALDAEGRVTSIVEGDPYTSNFSYNANDQLQTVSLPGGVQESMQYDPNSQLVGVTAQGPTTGGTFTSLSSQYQYTYDAASRVNSTTTLSGTDSLAYDGASRLSSETEQPGSTQVIAKGGTYGWTYDNNGNILTAIDDTGATDVYTYSTTIRNELTQMGATGDPVTKTNAYSYDGHGDVTSIANTAPSSDKNALVQHLSYDSQGRVNQVTYLDHSNGNTTTTITIGYNADGQRSDYTYTPQGQPPLDTQFQYRNGQLAEQRVVSDTTANGPVVIYTNTYLYGPTGEPLELLHAQPGQTVARYWYILDGQGSVVALTDANGSVVDRYAYDSWGESTSDDRTNEHVPQQLRYKAQYYDEKLTWYWMPDTRYYDPETERYLQPDDLGSYTYAGDYPVGADLTSGVVPGEGGGSLPTSSPNGFLPPDWQGFVDPCPYFEPNLGQIVYTPLDPDYQPFEGNPNWRALGLCAGFSKATLLPVPNVINEAGPQGVRKYRRRCATDDITYSRCERAHLVAASLGGPGIRQNIAYTTLRANRSGFAAIEREIKTQIANGYVVYYRVYIHYAAPSTFAPDYIYVLVTRLNKDPVEGEFGDTIEARACAVIFARINNTTSGDVTNLPLPPNSAQCVGSVFVPVP